MRKYLGANIKPEIWKGGLRRGWEVNPWEYVWSLSDWKQRIKISFFEVWYWWCDADGNAMLCCCLMFSRLETIYREKLWEHFRTNNHDRSCATLNIKSNWANIPSVCWIVPKIWLPSPFPLEAELCNGRHVMDDKFFSVISFFLNGNNKSGF